MCSLTGSIIDCSTMAAGDELPTTQEGKEGKEKRWIDDEKIFSVLTKRPEPYCWWSVRLRWSNWLHFHKNINPPLCVRDHKSSINTEQLEDKMENDSYKNIPLKKQRSFYTLPCSYICPCDLRSHTLFSPGRRSGCLILQCHTHTGCTGRNMNANMSSFYWQQWIQRSCYIVTKHD